MKISPLFVIKCILPFFLVHLFLAFNNKEVVLKINVLKTLQFVIRMRETNVHICIYKQI